MALLKRALVLAPHQELGLHRRVLENVAVLRDRDPQDAEAFVLQAETLRVVRPSMKLTDLVTQSLPLCKNGAHRARLLQLLEESGGKLKIP